MVKATDTQMQALDIAVLTVSDTRGEEDDSSGKYAFWVRVTWQFGEMRCRWPFDPARSSWSI